MKYIVIERYADNGEFSHYDLINTENGETAITDIDETLQLRQCAVSGLFCNCDKLPDGEIAISSKALQKPYGDLGQNNH